MGVSKLLVANRGEIAARVLRAAADLNIPTVAVHTGDDRASLHRHLADEVHELPGTGVSGYLDAEAIIGAALEHGADAIHPGYGFLAENAAFARACGAAGITFVGPSPALLDLFGDKVAARYAATLSGLPVLDASEGPTTLDQARTMLDRHGAIMLKAVAGGGGRGMRVVREPSELETAYARCRSEAASAFGDGKLYAEQLLANARHVEVQIVGDHTGKVIHLGTRDCSVQRRHQKLIETAPAPNLSDGLRERITQAAVDLGRSVGYDHVGTVEFLVDASASGDDGAFFFIETNPRIQVEHTVTEEVTGVDLVETQLALAGGAALDDLGLSAAPPSRGWAIQARINAETMTADGQALPATGTITTMELASGRGVRVDSAGYAGLEIDGTFDSLLAKLVVHRDGGTFADATAKLHRALGECLVGGVDTNLDLLQGIVGHPGFGSATTGFLTEHVDTLTAPDPSHRQRRPDSSPTPAGASTTAGGRLDSDDPLAVLSYGHEQGTTTTGAQLSSPGSPAHEPEDGTVVVRTPLQGTVVSIEVTEGAEVRSGQLVAVVEAMKMEHEIITPVPGIVTRIEAGPGDTLWADQTLVVVAESDVVETGEADIVEVDLDEIRPSLADMLELRARMYDDARPDAVDRRRRTGQRTARENVADLCDMDTFVEYGTMALAAQRRRRTREDLITKSPADGLITGVGTINGDQFGDPTARCAIMAYDYTVFAGTQGIRNHAKTDRIIDVAIQGRMPFVLYAEGGGGRPGDTDGGDFGSRTFSRFATMSALVPMVGVVSGRCYAGNASLLGCCDVIIATEGTNIGMGGPAMVEGGGLGVFRPEEIGPLDVQTRSGVVDIVAADETEATELARKYLSYFQGPTSGWEEHDQRLLRQAIPENRLRTYDIRALIDTMADVDSVLELTPDFGVGMVTALARVQGRPLGIIANNPNHLGGAIDSDGADKAARFMQILEAFDVPLLFLCDTPGIMVGPEIEKTALVRKSSRMFLIGANLTIPSFTVVVRKSYGLGSVAMAGGSYRVPMFTVAWPTAEFGPMGLEGAVKLGFRDELANIEDPDERKAKYDELVDKEYRRGRALNYATAFAIDDTIDPAETRHWLGNMMASLRPPPVRDTKKIPWIDGW